jgi:hypothetical protein
MKNTLIIAAVAFTTIFIDSCKKTSQQITRTSFEKQSDDGSLEQATTVASRWQTARWQSFESDEGGYLLRGKIHIDEDISDHENDFKLVFIRFRGREEYVYKSLPLMLSTSAGDFEMKYQILRESLTISITPDSNSNLPDISEVADLEYRYIIVPAEIFSGMMIDWNDYDIVSQALHI